MKYLIFNSDNEHYYHTDSDSLKDEALSQGHEVVDIENFKVLQSVRGEHDVEEFTIETSNED